MRKQTPLPFIAVPTVLLVLVLVSLSSCFKDNCRHTYTLYKPVFQTLTQARANMKSNVPQPVQQPGKIYWYGKYIFLNENNKGIHVIDNSKPSAPQNIAFINIPGNVDMAVKGNTLYADSYNDLVAFDISNPQQVVAKKFVDDAFPHRKSYYYYNSNTTNPDSIQVIVGWTTKDTTVECETYRYYYDTYYSLASADMSGYYSSPQVGTGGSMARFTLMNDYLYAVTYRDLNVFDISSPQDPSFVTKTRLGNWVIETIYPFKDKLFIGSNNGMLIYDAASNPADPSKVGEFAHVRSCDPVIADDNYAYVTLRSGNTCQGFTNQLDVVNISNLLAPSLQKTYSMTNPFGLSKDNGLLFICDGKDGLKVYNAANVNDIKLVKQISGIEPYDVIARYNIALVTAKDGLYQFDYADPADIKLISKIPVNGDM